MKFGKIGKILSWAVGATLVASVAWAAVGWRVDSYGNIKTARSTVLLAPEQHSNCKILVAATTLSVVGQNGSALSSSNPCMVGLKDGTVATFTAPVSVTFGAASDTDGNLFGISEMDWASEMPFFLEVITNGTTSYFTIARTRQRVSGAAASLCQKGDTDCDTNGDVMILASGLTIGDWTTKQFTPFAWFRATYATATASWTFLDTAPAGFNKEFKTFWWDYVPKQMGAQNVANCYFVKPTNNAPIFNNNTLKYRYGDDDWVDYWFYMANDGGNDGSDASAAQLTMPYVSVSTIELFGAGTAASATTLTNGTTTTVIAKPGYSYLYEQWTNTTPALTNVQNNYFSAGARSFWGSVRFPVVLN